MGHLTQIQQHWNHAMKPHATFSPISLRYIAALRGHRPKETGVDFTYAEAFCAEPEKLICLAASNPEGRFYGLVGDDATRRAAEDMAAQRGTFNIIFLTGSPAEILAKIDNGSSLPPMLDYLCCNEQNLALSDADRVALFDLAQKRMNPNGLLVRAYRAYNYNDGALRFLVQELAPEMNGAQKLEFLSEIKILGGRFLAKNPSLAAKLDDAIAKKAPKDFFAAFEGAVASSGTFDMLAAMGARGFAYAGDAALASNYVELSIPANAQDLIVSCRTNPLYEPIKDLALDRTLRTDIWIKPQDGSANPAELFGGFAYGIVLPPEAIPASFAAQGKAIDLSSTLYRNLIELMAIMPVGVGDVLQHALGKGEQPEKILEALQIMVACGFASPMRGTLKGTNSSSVMQPRLVGSFNRYLDKTPLSDKDVWFASQVMGCGVTVPAGDAFVMQAVNRAGLNNSVSALMPELQRIAKTPASLAVISAEEPTPEIAHRMITSIVSKSLPQWYAYALLEAA